MALLLFRAKSGGAIALPASPVPKDLHQPYRPVIHGGAGGAMAPPDFGRSVNPISISGDRLCPPNYYWHPWMYRPSDGPAVLSVVFSLRQHDFEETT